MRDSRHHGGLAKPNLDVLGGTEGGREAGEGSQHVCSPGPTVAGIFSSRAMKTLLDSASMELDTEKKDELEDAYESSVKVDHSKILSTVNTVFLSNKNTEKLDPPVTFSFSHDVSPWVGWWDQLYCSSNSQGHGGPSAVFISPPLPILLLP